MGRFYNEDILKKQKNVKYNSILAAISLFLTDTYGKDFDFNSALNNDMGNILSFSIVERESQVEVLSLQKYLNYHDVTTYYYFKDYIAPYEELIIDLSKLIKYVPDLENFIKQIIGDFNNSKDDLDTIVQKALHPGKIKLESSFIFNPTSKKIDKIKKDDFFEFLAAFLTEMERDKYTVKIDINRAFGFKSTNFGTGNEVYQTYNLMHNGEAVYSLRALSEYTEYFNGIISNVNSDLNTYISLSEAIEVIKSLKEKYSYMWYLQGVINTFYEDTSYTAESLANLIRKQYYNFD